MIPSPSDFALQEKDLLQALNKATARDVDFSDMYIESTISESVSMEESLVKRAVKSIGQGAGVRAIAGDRTGFAYSDDLSVKDLEIAAETARYIADSPRGDQPLAVTHRGAPSHNLYPLSQPLSEISTQERVELLNAIDLEARKYDSRITKVMASINTEQKVFLVVNTEGHLVGDMQPLARLQVTCIAEEGPNRQVGTFGGGGRVGFSFFLEHGRALEYAREAARQAIVNLEAIDAPAGTMPVVLAGGWPGILLHEAIGHGLEADFNRRKTSAFSDLMGQSVASELCTIVDDGTLPFRRGSLNVDDEGTTTTRTMLIEKGVLRGYITDRMNAKLMGIP
ncbi:MAG: metallopeptidase TldD-related protein [Nitrospirales bacterium]|nr:metallopeptidase TldD-related protein [Nitrospirales bacterium]